MIKEYDIYVGLLFNFSLNFLMHQSKETNKKINDLKLRFL